MLSGYIVQSFQLRGHKPVADQPRITRNGEAAMELAQRIGSEIADAMAFSQQVDTETDTSDEPRLLYRVGALALGLYEAQ